MSGNKHLAGIDDIPVVAIDRIVDFLGEDDRASFNNLSMVNKATRSMFMKEFPIDRFPMPTGIELLMTGLTVTSFSHDTRNIACGDEKGNIHNWNRKHGLVASWKCQGERSRVKKLDFVKASTCTPEDKYLLAALCENGVLQIWELDDSGHRFQWSCDGVANIAASPDGTLLSICPLDGSDCRVLNSADGLKTQKDRIMEQETHYEDEPTGDSWFWTTSPNGECILDPREKSGISLFYHKVDLESKKLRGSSGEAISSCFSPDGSLLAAAFGDRVELWDLNFVQEGGPTIYVRHEVTGGGSQIVCQFHDYAKNGKCIASLEKADIGFTQVCFSPDGKLLLTRSPESGTVRLWSVKKFLQDYACSDEPSGQQNETGVGPDWDSLLGQLLVDGFDFTQMVVIPHD